ncbi:MAG TPA: DUF1501 domain-containing protein [Rudaea sp.]|jgi:uncharacterized protein (DUF1501 family)|nr:DUF1501 domain-containing protein [Rudaea sp.]
MSYSRNSRREFLRNMACVACSGGAAAMIPQLRMLGTAMAATSSLSGYKALVCIYLQGGNDSWNLVVPWDSNGSNQRFDVYAAARNGVYNSQNQGGLGLARPASGSAQIVTDGNNSNTSTNKYFMHPNLPNLTKYFNANKLAFAVNVGTLVQPMNMTDYNKATFPKPPQLFSHADQTNLWNQANTNSNTAQGWGGLCADDLQAQGANLTTNPKLPLCISIAGANRFEIGNVVNNPYQLSSGGLANLSAMCNQTPCGTGNNSVRDQALNELLGATYANDFAGEYGNVFGDGRALFTQIKPNLGVDHTHDTPPGANYSVPTSPNTTAFPTTGLGNQLKVVAQMIKLSKASGYATRQIFFVQVGGFDLHSGMMSSADTGTPPTSDHAGLLKQLDDAVAAFWTEMGPTGQNLANNVTLFSATEFARTLQSNGAGSDHGWGGVHFALGGAVNGGKLYTQGIGGLNGKSIDGAFPNLAYGKMANPNANSFSRGQMIPGLSVDQYAATFAKWMDVRPTGSTGVSAIFPNLANFPGGTLGLLPTT